ncbi:hypothetical protein ILYODFUR_008153 [Ilyodon furcidens]|uniref:Uncharacterized protein n=1 Tax=Ilyodon furcidens TaxID=33524 RepID=A0ABV0TGW9_9TELE
MAERLEPVVIDKPLKVRGDKKIVVRLQPKLFGSPVTRVCSSSEGVLLRLDPNPPGNQEVGGPGRAGSRSSHSLDEWEFVSFLETDRERLLCAHDRLTFCFVVILPNQRFPMPVQRDFSARQLKV